MNVDVPNLIDMLIMARTTTQQMIKVHQNGCVVRADLMVTCLSVDFGL